MNFWQLTKDEIIRGLDACYDSKIFNELMGEQSELISFAIDSELQQLAELYVNCNYDMLMTKLIYEKNQ